MIFPFSLLAGCSFFQSQLESSTNGEIAGNIVQQVSEDYVSGKELMCLVDTEDEAKAIAKQYNIELVEFSYGVATFHTDENPNDVIAMGKKLGYPELSLNGVMHTY